MKHEQLTTKISTLTAKPIISFSFCIKPKTITKPRAHHKPQNHQKPQTFQLHWNQIEFKFNTKFTCRRILRNLSWASLIVKARSLLELISRRWSFLTLLTKPSTPPIRGRFLAATTLRPLHGRGLADILLPPSISKKIQTCSIPAP